MVPAFNLPYLPMVEPVVRAVVDQDCFALVEAARLERIKFGAIGPAAVVNEFREWGGMSLLGMDVGATVCKSAPAAAQGPVREWMRRICLFRGGSL